MKIKLEEIRLFKKTLQKHIEDLKRGDMITIREEKILSDLEKGEKVYSIKNDSLKNLQRDVNINNKRDKWLTS